MTSLPSGEGLISDWYVYTLWKTFRDYFINSKMSLAVWSTIRDARPKLLFTANRLMKKLRS